MLYAFYGGDEAKAKDKAEALVSSLLEKRPDASVRRFDAESFSPDLIPELLQGQGLFVEKCIVILDRVLGSDAHQATLLKVLPEVAQSDNIFVVIEGELLAAPKKKLEQHASKTQHFAADKKTTERFNAFALADALGARDKKRLWLLYQEALLNGLVAEELHGTLVWQVKSMALTHVTTTPDEAGMKPFPYKKAQGFAKNYSPDEVKEKWFSLLEVYHEARRGKGELSVLLEKWVLAL